MLHGRNLLKEKLASGNAAAGLWITIESPHLTELAATMGFDWVVIDAEHGHLDFKEILEHLRAVRGSPITPLVRIPEISGGFIKRVLDLGAEGILVPQVTSAEDVTAAVGFAKYPPWGMRGVCADRATQWGANLKAYTECANDEILVLPIIETVAAADAIEDILAVTGVDALIFGPADFSASMGHLGQWEGPGVAERILEIKQLANDRGIPCGILANSPENAALRRKQGFAMVGVGTDMMLFRRAAQEGLDALRGVRRA